MNHLHLDDGLSSCEAGRQVLVTRPVLVVKVQRGFTGGELSEARQGEPVQKERDDRLIQRRRRKASVALYRPGYPNDAYGPRKFNGIVRTIETGRLYKRIPANKP